MSFMSHLSSIQLAQAADEAPSFPEADDRAPVKTVWVVVTAYNSVPGQTDNSPCITANGHDLCKQYTEQGFGNTIAANFMQFGTVVRMPELFGDKQFVVRDRMNARYGYGRMDVWVPTVEEARAFGVQRVKMEIYN
jgi:3D (Asp-Asp-Asp) domain-containing protein